ncbi:MAG: glycosyl hydrolase family 65 protein [Bacteroidales bacterium]
MMKYNKGTEEFKNWLITETDFDPRFQGKCETIFCQGNGYMGMRTATEERYINQVRNTFVSGTFNKFDEYDVTELPNAADVSNIDIRIDGKLFGLDKGSFSDYHRTLNLKTGEVTREFTWKNQAGKAFQFSFKRFISFDNLHLMAAGIEIKAMNQSAKIEFNSGINGQMTNSGAQHFHEGEKRIFDKKYVQMLQQTTQSGITFIHNTAHSVSSHGAEVTSRFEMDRRKVLMIYNAEIGVNQTIRLEKISNLYTTRDKESESLSLESLREYSIGQLKSACRLGYDSLLNLSAKVWSEKWKAIDIRIESNDDFNQLAIRFVQYHLLIMTPAHDSRMGIGAKGLSGEGYKGHSFWDTELFMLPFFTFTQPHIARSLLEYRFNTINGARKKAIENGYKGAMFPWESAWADDDEVTPVWGAADIITGESTKIWSGFIEQHITSDISFAIWQYYQVTGDEDFMNKYGYEILLDTGIFWASRLEWDENEKRYHINEVIGPDEYKEHVNNDAFTNYTAHWCIENAIHYYHLLKSEKPEIFSRLESVLNLESEIKELKEKLPLIYLPQPDENNIIPQDDTYLTLKDIDLTKYKNQEHVGSLFLDYSLSQVGKMQVSKQASVVMLMYLLEHKFSREVKQANYNYYESRTLHDSSLSFSTHSILANDLENTDLAYSLYRQAAAIDLGMNMKSSDHGIHGASLGGVWQIIVCGFGGIRMISGKLRIEPKLPKEITQITYPLYWKGNLLEVTVNHEILQVNNKGAEPVTFSHYGKDYKVNSNSEIKI